MRGDHDPVPGGPVQADRSATALPDAPGPQRRLIVILFADLTGSTAIAAGMEPEQYAELLEQLRAIVRQIIAAHGGDIVRIDGDGALCIFGHPHLFEDAGRRATEAALDLHAAMNALDAAYAVPGHPITLHCGIHAGTVLVRAGDLVRGKVEIIGDATNVAARLCDAAGPGETLITPETLGSDEAFFLHRHGPSVAATGRRVPVQSWQITGRSRIAHRFAGREQHGLTPLVGRQHELGQFAAWLGASAGPALMTIHAAAGIGKSRFVGACADWAVAQGWHVARGYCEAYLGARPLQPFLQIAGDDPELLDARIAAMLAAALTSPGLLLIIDDWQWSDDASRDTLATLAAAGGPARLKILVASREADTGLSSDIPVALLPIPPLSRDESLAAIGALLGSPDPFAIGRIEQAAGGSPLLIEELCHAHAAGGAPDAELRGAWFDIAIQARFARLEPRDADLLRVAAAIGHTIPLWLFRALRSEANDDLVMQRLQASDFLFAGETPDTVRFKHGLTRDALYAALGRAERQQLHTEILGALEERAASVGEAGLRDALAYHSNAAGAAAKARVHAIAAGDAALALGALDRAQAHYAASFALADSHPEPQERLRHARSILNRYGIACIVDPAEDQLELLVAARDRFVAADDASGVVRGEYWLGAITYGVGLGKASVKHLELALQKARALGQDEITAQIELKLAQSLISVGRYADADAAFARAMPPFNVNCEHRDWEALAYGFSCRGFMLADQGNFGASDGHYTEARRLIAGRSSPVLASILTQNAAIALWRGDWDLAIQIAESCLEGSTRSRQRFQTVIALAIKSYAEWQNGHGPGDIERIESGARWFMSGGNSRQRSSLIFGCLTDIMADGGDRIGARRHACHMVGRVRTGGDRIGEAMAWRALARLEARARRVARADHYLNLARRSADARQSRREAAQNLLCEAELAEMRGAADQQRALATAAASEFTAMAMPRFMEQAQALATG
jgi:class 3 adenylate cyclase/tetratricopeptide (TPR) repeat protein